MSLGGKSPPAETTPRWHRWVQRKRVQALPFREEESLCPVEEGTPAARTQGPALPRRSFLSEGVSRQRLGHAVLEKESRLEGGLALPQEDA